MKILQVCHEYYPHIGGVEEHVKKISERLVKKDNTVTVFACDPSGELPREEEIEGVLVKRFKSFSRSDAYHFSIEMLREMRGCEFDVVHGHNYHAFPLHFCRYVKKRRFVVSPHYHGRGSSTFRDLLLRICKPFGKTVFADAHSILAVSDYERRLLLRDFPVSENKLRLIPNGVDLQEFADVESTPRYLKTILYVGRLEKYKGVQHIIKALPLINNDFCLKIVGRGPYEGKIIQLIRGLNLNHRVQLCHDLSRHELLRTYAGAGVLMLLSQREASSLVVAEALASGTPCILGKTSGLAEWIDNKNCYGIEWPIKSDQLARLVREVAGQKVSDVKLYDWDDIAEEVIRQYAYD